MDTYQYRSYLYSYRPVSIYIRLIFIPVKPIHLEPEPQTLSIDMLEPEEMLEDFAYLVEVIESVHPTLSSYRKRGMDQGEKCSVERLLPMRAADYYFALNELVVAVGMPILFCGLMKPIKAAAVF